MISVFTPSHGPRWLDECYTCLKEQTYDDWEWIVLLNGRAHWTPPDDIRVHVESTNVKGVGALKRLACSECSGDILVELDHDDRLMPTALAEIFSAVRNNPDAALIYSQFAQITEDGSPDYSRFDSAHGWEYRDFDSRIYPLAMEPSPHNVSYIWYAPNHVRAFPRWAYDKAGGYDEKRTILDDQDLMCRLYQHGDFVCIDQVLYLQRIHPGNTQRDARTNAQIQNDTVELYDQWIQPNAMAWANRNGLECLDLGAAHGKPPGYIGVDAVESAGVDIVCDLPDRLPFEDSSVGVIRAVDTLEHIKDPVALMNELWRVLAPGGLLLTITPSTDGRGAFQDPTHVSFWNENSFWYYTNPQFQQYVPSIKARFQVSRLISQFPSDWHRRSSIPYVTANLIALKGLMGRQGGMLLWSELDLVQ